MLIDNVFNRFTATICAVLGLMFLPGAWGATSSGVRSEVVGTEQITHPLEQKDLEIPVHGEIGDVIGWWKISYPATLPIEGSRPLTISYIPDHAAWGDGRPRPRKMAVSFESKDFVAEPEPCLFKVDVSQMSHGFLVQDRTWALSASKDAKNYRDYNLILVFDIQPSTFRNGSYQLNGTTPTENGVSIPLPFNLPLPIETRPVIVMQEVFWTLGRSAIAGIGFIMALPAVTEIVKALIARSDRKKAPTPQSSESTPS